MKSHRLLTDDVIRELHARRAGIDEVDEILAAIERTAWTPDVYHGRTPIPWGLSRPGPRRTLDSRLDPIPPGFQEVHPEDLMLPESASKTEAA
jgi:hypothetical protein